MTRYTKNEAKITVPRNTGVDGLILAVRSILKLPRVSIITITQKGEVSYTRHIPEGQKETNLGVNFDELAPSYIVQRSDIREVYEVQDQNSSTAIGQLFSAVAQDHLHPVAFVTGADTVLWDWYHRSTGLQLYRGDTLFGFPLLFDRFYEDNLLLLCAGYGSDSGLADTQASYKLTMKAGYCPDTLVKIL